MNINEGRALKRNRLVRFYDEHGDPIRKDTNVVADIHIPMKKESKVLRRLMAETGLSEEQLRQHKKYRIQLSQAQKTERRTFWNQHDIDVDNHLDRVFKMALTKFNTTSRWDPRVQGEVLRDLSPGSTFSMYWRRDEIRKNALDRFNSKWRRKDKAVV